MENGQCEQMNCTLINMLKTLSDEHKRDWKNHLSKLMFGYNSMVCSSTGFSPHYLMFGRESRLPVDFIFNVERRGVTDQDFVEKWKTSMKEACNIAKKNIQKSSSHGKKGYDKKVLEDHTSYLGKV